MAQSRFVHEEANKGVPWATKFLADSQHGPGSLNGLPQHVRNLHRAIGKRLMARGH